MPARGRLNDERWRVRLAYSLGAGLEWLRLDGPGKALLEEPETEGGFTLAERPRELQDA